MAAGAPRALGSPGGGATSVRGIPGGVGGRSAGLPDAGPSWARASGAQVNTSTSAQYDCCRSGRARYISDGGRAGRLQFGTMLVTLPGLPVPRSLVLATSIIRPAPRQMSWWWAPEKSRQAVMLELATEFWHVNEKWEATLVADAGRAGSSLGDGSRLPRKYSVSFTAHTGQHRSASDRSEPADKYSVPRCACASAEMDSCIQAVAAR